MWWTQPKLALIAWGVNALGYASITFAVASSEARFALLAGAQLLLLTVYWRISKRLAEGHLAGRTEIAFDHNLWNKEWKPSIDWLNHPTANFPRQDGDSFYRQVVGDTPEARDAVYRALAAWEGARLLWPGGLVGLGVALAVGLAPLLAWPGGTPWYLLAPAAATLSLWSLVLPESFNILLLQRYILRSGMTERVALLVPRTAVDVGLFAQEPDPDAAPWEAAWVFGVAWGVPLVIFITLATGLRGLALAVVGGGLVIAAIVYSWRAYRRMLVSSIPFLRLSPLPEVNVMLDLMHRQRAYLSFHPLTAVMMSLLYFMEPTRYFFVAPAILWELGYVLAVTFGDQLSGYAGFYTATNFEQCYRRSLEKVQASTS